VILEKDALKEAIKSKSEAIELLTVKNLDLDEIINQNSSNLQSSKDLVDRIKQENLVLEETVQRNKKAISQADQSKQKL
jgi:hypothetical protein